MYRQHADLNPRQPTRTERALGYLVAIAIGLALAATLISALS